MNNSSEKHADKKSPQKSRWKLFIEVMLGNLLVLLARGGFILIAMTLHNISYKEKQYFTPKTEEMQGITPYYGDAFFERCPVRYFYCRNSEFTTVRNGWYTRCFCYEPNVATYAVSPGLVLGEYNNSGNMPLEQRTRIQYWALQIFYAYLVTGIIIYLFRRKMRK